MKTKYLVLILAIVCALALCACQGSSKTDSGKNSGKEDKTSSNVSDSDPSKDDASSQNADTDAHADDPTPTPEPVVLTDPTATPTPEPTPAPAKSYEKIEDYYGDYVTEDGGSMTFGYDTKNDCYRLYNVLFNGEYNPGEEYSWLSWSEYLDMFDGYFTSDMIKHSSDVYDVEMAYLHGRRSSYEYERFAYGVSFNADGSVEMCLLDMASGVKEKATFTKAE